MPGNLGVGQKYESERTYSERIRQSIVNRPTSGRASVLFKIQTRTLATNKLDLTVLVNSKRRLASTER